MSGFSRIQSSRLSPTHSRSKLTALLLVLLTSSAAFAAEIPQQLATVATFASAGLCEQATRLGRPLIATAKEIGYLPLQAEAFRAFGRMHDSCLDTKEACLP